MIKSTAPTRIDLAGGTLDIWPLYLQFGNPPTLNAAINLYATVELTPRNDRKIFVESKDLPCQARFNSVASLPESHPLDLILKTLKYYQPKKGLNIVTSSEAPPGSGIGGSSALNIALHGALNVFTKKGLGKKQMLEAAMNIVDYLMTGGAMLSLYTIPPMLIAGFLTPWPYNYWRLKKYNKSCC